jgi:hypothetical protein
MTQGNDYVWKHNGPLPNADNATSVRFTKPLKEGRMFADLRNGRTYNVLAISKVKEPGYFKHVPNEMMHTSDAKPLADGELATLRNLHKADEDPDWPYLILP